MTRLRFACAAAPGFPAQTRGTGTAPNPKIVLGKTDGPSGDDGWTYVGAVERRGERGTGMGGSLKVVSIGDRDGDPTCSDLSVCRLTSESSVFHGWPRISFSVSSCVSFCARCFPLLLADAAGINVVNVGVVVFVAKSLERRVEVIVRVTFSFGCCCEGPAAAAFGTM